LFAHPGLQAVICISQMVRDDIRAHFAIPDERLHVIYNAVDPRGFGPPVRAQRESTRAALGLGEHDVAFLLVGSGYPRKGVAVAIRALTRLPANAQLVIVGRDKDPARYVALARRLGVGERVVFTGPQLDPRPYYGAADAFVLPTLYDPLSNAAPKPSHADSRGDEHALWAGELVVAHDAGWICDALTTPA
jgi:UDP-glucose:(heptosyl)LPS alpha-1,3-glucosyltransferase